MKKNGSIIIIFVHKSQNKNVLQLVIKEDHHLQQNLYIVEISKGSSSNTIC